MKTWQYALLIIVGIVVLIVILNLVPSTSHLVRGVVTILKWIWNAVEGTFTLAIVLGFGAFFGLLTKAFGAAYLDLRLEEGKEITTAQHWGIAVVFGLVCGVIQTLLMPHFMGWNTWMRSIAIDWFSWSGVYETPPLAWLFYCFGVFVAVYMITPYVDYES